MTRAIKISALHNVMGFDGVEKIRSFSDVLRSHHSPYHTTEPTEGSREACAITFASREHEQFLIVHTQVYDLS